MTTSQISRQDAAVELLRRRKARTNLLDFIRYTKPDYEVNWHHQLLCDYVDRWVSGDITRLMIFEPPRTGKSEIVSRRLPAYLLGRNPNARIGAISYSTDLSSRMNRDVQRIIDSKEYQRLFPQTQLWNKATRAVSENHYARTSDFFEVVGATGSYRSAGVGSGITGMGFDYGIIDDPLKDRLEADSATVRGNQWDWYTSTFYTRLEKGGRVLMTLTRWHYDDIAGRALELMKESGLTDRWTVLSLPAIAEGELHSDDPRDDGEALWPEKYDLEYYERLRAQNAYEFEALYQQRPVPRGSGLFNTELIEIIDAPPTCKRIVRFYDLAVTAKKHSDWTDGLKMGIADNGDVIIYDNYRAQKPAPEVHEAIIQNAHIDGKAVHIRLEAEKAGIVQLDWMLVDKRLHGYTMDAKPPQGDKYTRAQPFATRVNNGKVKLVRGQWNRAFIDELAMFPQGAHDDQVDAASGAYEYLDPNRQTTIEVDYSTDLFDNWG